MRYPDMKPHRDQNIWQHRSSYVPAKQRGGWRIVLAEVVLSLVLAGALLALLLMYFDVARFA